ncbi:MAG: hypothetical protein K6T51_06800 [Rubrobacteraceae bacterium]|uniref:hypothetical protein n=1 Tax=Rubrobacter naiadicus TaxID=1392641 RepID=UPI002362980B|nr:hypothetical protein [Rubrobacter naiadicus]MBX6762787.1 hypothetical protein [Rubrobacteraceae bacterium]MCL6438300.1 hypothetical protein [Rubrobacteraceae bacterium]
MNRFEEEIYRCMDPVARLLEVTENPHHRAILENYRRHVHLEGSGQFEKIVAPDMMVDEPVYRINWGRPTVIRGKQGVIDFYRSAERYVMWNSEDRIAVADWGLCDELTFHFLTTGDILEEFGIEVENREAHYHFTSRQAFVWPYDEQARLIGEHLYVDETSISVEEVDPSEVVSPDRSREIHLELLARLESVPG